MSMSAWKKRNTVQYRGHDIYLGNVSLNDQPLLAAFCPIEPTAEQKSDLLAKAKAFVDKRLDK